jgi:Cd2+/Zn2+-exporting ATPase
MDCAEEVTVLKRELGPLVGGEGNLAFDILNAKMTVAAGASASPDALQAAVARTGMRAEPWRDEKTVLGGEGFWERNRRTVLTAASGGLLLCGVLAHAWAAGPRAAFGFEEAGHRVPLTAITLYALSTLAGLWTVLPKAWTAARRVRPDMNLLMTVAVSGAVAIGEWFEAATVAFLFALSLALEAWSVGRARRAVAALMDLTPPVARLLGPGGREELVPPSQVSVGERFLVRPGDRVPLDGRIVAGTSGIDQSPITGESIPVPKGPGDEVFAGTINGDGSLTVESTKPASDTTLARITRMVGEAQSRRAPSEQWVERFARYYTPAVMGLALLVLVVPPLLGGTWSDWLYRSLVLLVIACPCALVISTPVSIVAALAASARHGVLIKGGVYVEAPARLKAVAFDKTGTLTEGRPSVVEVVPLGGYSERELLERAAALEAQSTHPLARAVLTYAKRQGITTQAADDFRIFPGKGAEGRVGGELYWVGSHRYLEERGEETPEVRERLAAMTKSGKTVVVVGGERHVLGLIALADTVRPASRQTVSDLRAAGIEHIVMLTGDNLGTAEAVARETGVDEVYAELLPADKVAKVEELVSRYGQVAMLGDGVNDAPAMARATLGVAMGAAGTDAAIETADVALMSDDLAKLPWLVRHSQRSLSVIRQNIAFSLGVKALFVALTFAGAASLWAAIAADMGASLLVVFNGLRLLRG